MKSFFALATVFALAIVPLAVADRVSKGTPATLNSNFVTGFILQVPKVNGTSSPKSGSDVIIGQLRNTSSSSVWMLTNGTQAVGHIQLRDKGSGNIDLCLTSSKAGSDPAHGATVDKCDDDDINQDWTVPDGNQTRITQGQECLTIQQDNHKVVVIECSENEPGRFWNAIPGLIS